MYFVNRETKAKLFLAVTVTNNFNIRTSFFMKTVMFLLHMHVNYLDTISFFLMLIGGRFLFCFVLFSFSWTLSLLWSEFAYRNVTFSLNFYFWYCNPIFLIKKISNSFISNFQKTLMQPFACFMQNLILYKICVLKHFVNFTEKHLCWSLIFIKVAIWIAATLSKKRLWHRHFADNFAKYLRTSSLKNTSERLRLLLSHETPNYWIFLSYNLPNVYLMIL